jgi:hypothetical protein
LGNFGVFVPPKAGASFRLDLKDAPKLRKLSFDEERSRPDAVVALPYISLPAPLAVEAVRYTPKGAFRSLRLLSKRGSSSITIDVVQANPQRFQVWVLAQEDDRVIAVGLLECESDGAFPDQPK